MSTFARTTLVVLLRACESTVWPLRLILKAGRLDRGHYGRYHLKKTVRRFLLGIGGEMITGLETRRKLIHLSAMSIPICYYFIPEYISKPALLLVTSGFIVIEVLRLRFPSLKAVFMNVARSLIREHELTTLTGSTYLLISSSICVLLVRKEIAIAAISYLILGDSTAAIVGKRFGRVRIFGKTLEGFLGCFVVCLAIGLLIPRISLHTAMAGALTASLVELLPIKVDDNLRIPLIAAGVMRFLELL
jgi:dolichol kinase